MAYITITAAMIDAGVAAYRKSGGAAITDTIRQVLDAAFAAGEIRSEPDPNPVVSVTLYDHHKNPETLRLPINAAPYDLGPRGAVVRKIEVRA